MLQENYLLCKPVLQGSDSDSASVAACQLTCVQGTVGNAPASLGTRRRLLTEAAADMEDEGPGSPLADASGEPPVFKSSVCERLLQSHTVTQCNVSSSEVAITASHVMFAQVDLVAL
jgi:hypothetical protein